MLVYNGILGSVEELYEKMNLITNEANSRVCQATGLAPILAFKVEKEHLLPLPNAKVCSYYKNVTITAKVNTSSLFKYKGNMYSVPPNMIGKNITIEVIDSNLNVYYNKKLITVHSISENKINYHSNHHLQMLGLTFKGLGDEEIKDYAEKHFKELEKFNEQLSTVTTKST